MFRPSCRLWVYNIVPAVTAVGGDLVWVRVIGKLPVTPTANKYCNNTEGKENNLKQRRMYVIIFALTISLVTNPLLMNSVLISFLKLHHHQIFRRCGHCWTKQ